MYNAEAHADMYTTTPMTTKHNAGYHAYGMNNIPT